MHAHHQTLHNHWSDDIKKNCKVISQKSRSNEGTMMGLSEGPKCVERGCFVPVCDAVIGLAFIPFYKPIFCLFQEMTALLGLCRRLTSLSVGSVPHLRQHASVKTGVILSGKSVTAKSTLMQLKYHVLRPYEIWGNIISQSVTIIFPAPVRTSKNRDFTILVD